MEIVRTNGSYRPAWVARVRGVRALFRLLPYMMALWRAASRADIFHVMANSGWSWHLYAAPAVWIAWLRRKPAIVNYRGGEAESFFSNSWMWVRPTIRRARAVVVPSTFLKDVFESRGVAVAVVPNIVDLERFSHCESVEKRTRHSHGWPHVVITRNLEDIYDIPTAMRAFDRVRHAYPNARLSIAGDGPERANLEVLAIELAAASSIAFIGSLDNAEIADLYCSADLMLNPSLIDNMPISILEALACGVPVVSTNVGGVPHLVSHGETALLVPPGEPARMAEAALSLLEDREFFDLLVERGLAHVKRFGWDHVRDRLTVVYDEVQSKASRENIVQPSGR